MNAESFERDFPQTARLILIDFETLNNMSKEVESIKEKLENLPVYQFDEIASQRLDMLKNSFNQFQFEVFSVEQQYCDSIVPFNLDDMVAKLQLKVLAFENEIKSLETYLYRIG